MSPQARRLLAVTAAVMVLAAAASADESAIPANAVVRVGDGAIKRSTFKHWLGIAASSNTSGPRIFYHPPNFVSCVKRKRESNSGTRAQLKTQCELEYEGLRDQVLQFLILERWVAGEAAARGVALTPAQVDKAFREAKHDAFPKESDFQKFLKQSGMTVADARFQVAFNTLYTKLRELAIAAAPAVTDAEVAAYYAENTERFAEPERRDVLVVLTKTRAKADAARAALERGQTFRHVARTYSIDKASARNGGLLLGVAEGSQEKALDDALFRAPVGKLRGPIKTKFGYYVFKVVKIARAKQLTLAEASDAIHDELTSTRQQEADDTFNTELRATWRPRTWCREGYIMEQCANGPLPASDEPADSRASRRGTGNERS